LKHLRIAGAAGLRVPTPGSGDDDLSSWM
jgi:hypothetical protein